ncbi:MAG: CehA/McbA family metallohydrolase [Opitutaceae bacterium]|nr:CehA/McbA family metallohydrolase [Opitutaceae bacterium]
MGVRRIARVVLVSTLWAGGVTQAHETTRRAFEATLEPREASALFASGSLVRTAVSAGVTGRECRVTLQAVDAATGRPMPALIRVRNERGQALEVPGLVCRGIKLRANHPAKEWYVLPGNAELRLPAAVLSVEAFSGLETERSFIVLDLRGKTQARHELPLRRFHDAAAAGWRAGNTHLHLRGLTRAQADEYLRNIPRGDGLELVFVSYLERARDADYITNDYGAADLAALEQPGLRFGNGEEHRHNFGSGGEGYGHVMFLNLPELVRPVSIGSGITGAGPDYPALRPGIDRARQLGATVIWCHNAFGMEHAPSWLSGRLHAHNIFDGGSQGSYARTFYRLLNVGLKVPFSAGTDWFIYDFSRVYVRAASPVRVDSWLGGLAAGRTFISNGPLLELRVGRHEIGDTVALDGAGELTVRGRAVGRVDFRGLELVHDGAVVRQVPAQAIDGHFVAEFEHTLPVRHSGWIAARVSGGSLEGDGPVVVPPNLPVRATGTGTNEMGEAIFAHTSPVYVEVSGRPHFDARAAEALITSIEESRRTIQAKARFDRDDQADEVLNIYTVAIETLRRRLGR